MTRLDRCAGQDAERAVRQSGMRVRCCNVIPAAGYGSFAVAAKACWQHSGHPNDVRIPWDRSPRPGPSSAPHRPARQAPSTRNSPGGSPMQPKIQKESNGQRFFRMVDSDRQPSLVNITWFADRINKGGVSVGLSHVDERSERRCCGVALFFWHAISRLDITMIFETFGAGLFLLCLMAI